MTTEPAAGPFAPRDIAPAGAERRKHDRQAVNWPAVCRAESFGQWNVTIVDASDGGFGLDRSLPIPLDAPFWIELASIGTFLCRVAWSANGRCGVELVDGPLAIPAGEIETLGNLLLDARL